MSILDLFDSILDLGVYIWASRYRLCPDFGALVTRQFKIGPLIVDFVLSGLKFGSLRVDFGRSLDSIFGLGGINCRPLGFGFRTWGYNLGLYSSRFDL